MISNINQDLKTSARRKREDPKHNRNCRVYCIDCFAAIESECICDRIVGYDAVTGYPVVDVTEEEWAYLYNQCLGDVGDA